MGHKPYFLSAFAAALLLLGLYPLGWFGCAWLAWIPLFAMTEILSAKPRQLFALIFLIFFIYYSVGNYWLIYYQIPLLFAVACFAATVITLYFGLYYLLTCSLASSGRLLSKSFALSRFGRCYNILSASRLSQLPCSRPLSMARRSFSRSLRSPNTASSEPWSLRFLFQSFSMQENDASKTLYGSLRYPPALRDFMAGAITGSKILASQNRRPG